MKIGNIGISIRLGAFVALFLLALIGAGVGDWHFLRADHDRQDDTSQRVILLENSVNLARSAQVNFKIQVQDWKDILLRGQDSREFNEYLKGFNQQHDLTQANLQRLNGELISLGLDNNLVQATQKIHADLRQKYLRALSKFDPANPNSRYQVDAEVMGIDRAPTERFDEMVDSVLKQSDEMRKTSEINADSAFRATSLWSLLIVMIALVFGASLAVKYGGQGRIRH
jgi:hypothetical protein